MNPKQPLFSLGQVVATPAALRAIEQAQEVSATSIYRHRTGDWEEMSRDDQRANEQALKDGGRIFSSYKMKTGEKVWVITEGTNDEGKRESTCVLLPDDS